MHFRKLILLAFAAAFVVPLAAQPVSKYTYVDSATYRMFSDGRWKSLDSIGRLAIAAGNDFPYLRMRMGYAAYMRGNYDRSLNQYAISMKQDPTNQGVLEMRAINNLFLGRTEAAEYFYGKLDDTIRKKYTTRAFDLISGLDAEGGSSFPNDSTRRNSGVFRAGLRTRIGWRWTLYQSYGYFAQTVTGTPPVPNVPPPTINVKQNDYFIRTKYQATANLNFMLGYHFYAYSTKPNREPPPGVPHYGTVDFKGNILFAGTTVFLPRVSLNAQAAFASQDSSKMQQYSLTATYMPFGNLNFYVLATAYLQQGTTTRVVPSPGIGFHPQKRVWIEGTFTYGNFNNLYEGEGVYIVNMYDNSQDRISASAHVMLSKHLFLNLSYLQEHKFYQNQTSKVMYSQPTITGGLSWKH